MDSPDLKVVDCVANVCQDDPAMEIWEGPPGRIEWFEPDPPRDAIDRVSFS
jgi:hypothetical protein